LTKKQQQELMKEKKAQEKVLAKEERERKALIAKEEREIKKAEEKKERERKALIAKEEREIKKAEEKEEKEREKVEKKRLEKERNDIIKQVTDKVKKDEEKKRNTIIAKLKQADQKKAEKANGKYEVNEAARARMFKTGKAFGQKGWRAQEFTEKFIEMHGNINPYTGEAVEADSTYDLSAAIRGLMYECSPSSTQHWFRFGLRKKSEQVSPWFFYNKELAQANAKHGWCVSTATQATMRRREKGKWYVLTDGSHASYDWNDDVYGPKPTAEVLAAATIGRVVGSRQSNA
jgi:hypothetical protein